MKSGYSDWMLHQWPTYGCDHRNDIGYIEEIDCFCLTSLVVVQSMTAKSALQIMLRCILPEENSTILSAEASDVQTFAVGRCGSLYYDDW